MALRPDALTACHRIFVTEIARWHKASSGLPGAQTGSVTFVQRFHATLGSFVHFHVVQTDGVFTLGGDGAVRFHAGRAPSREELAEVAGRVAKRMTKWLRPRKLLDERPAEERSNEAPEVSALEACMQLSLFGGTFLRVGGGVVLDADDDHRRGRKSPWAAEVDGFNIHAGCSSTRAIAKGSSDCAATSPARPSALERISLLTDGRVAYLLKKPRRRRDAPGRAPPPRAPRSRGQRLRV